MLSLRSNRGTSRNGGQLSPIDGRLRRVRNGGVRKWERKGGWETGGDRGGGVLVCASASVE